MPANSSLGEMLRALRLRRGISRTQLCQRAQLASRTVEYWEAGWRSPRMPELVSALHTLEATEPERAQILALLTTPRGMRLAHSESRTNALPDSPSDPLPNLGDLMRAMRLRRGWTQERLAEAMGIRRLTVQRWETTHNYPTEESLFRLCGILEASPHELTALRSRRLMPARWTSPLSIEECAQQCEQLYALVPNGWSPLMDLSMIAVERRLRLLTPTSPHALYLLAQLGQHYATWLLYQEREREAQIVLSAALEVAAAAPTPYPFAPGLFNLQSNLIRKGPGGAQAAVTMLQATTCRLPEGLRPTLYCDAAFYTATLQPPDGVAYWLGRARQAFERGCGEPAEENPYYRVTFARALIEQRKPVEAMRWLPEVASSSHPFPQFPTLYYWSQALLVAGEKDSAAQHLGRMEALLTLHEIPLRRRQWEALTQQL
jgi:transcriptional regulator with XRE-family HTH domain